ncbi:MAG TPA: YbdK family carboxylate-amine ligase [Solirubrobacteraceae bacterium]|nr:YbdK family carboxylate-amine ligase [Solirubrobacteraceae bacterium]
MADTQLNAAEIRRRFDATGGYTVGVEEEVMLLEPDTGELAPVAELVLARLEGDPRFTSELPAAQLEIRTAPATTAAEAVAQLATARRDLAAAARGLAKIAVAGVHPTAAPVGQLSQEARYASLIREYRPVAQRQLVAGLQVHVAVGGADRSLAVYNSLIRYLPEVMALSANAPFYAGQDSGMATVRPSICVDLPRQGPPPRLESWEELTGELRWGEIAGTVPDPSRWWWELRPHVGHGTLELRVPDAQTTLREAAGVIVLARALVAALAVGHDAGRRPDPRPTWRIAENRWSAARHGLDGELADLDTGQRTATRRRLDDLIDELAPVAGRLGDEGLLPLARALVEANGAVHQRAAVARTGLEALPHWLADRFLLDVERFASRARG